MIMMIIFVVAGIQLSTEPEVMAEQGRMHWRTILAHYAGIISIAVLGLLLAVIIPVVGLFVCCCRCAGSTDERSSSRFLPPPARLLFPFSFLFTIHFGKSLSHSGRRDDGAAGLGGRVDEQERTIRMFVIC